jgi:hypothetical protein
MKTSTSIKSYLDEMLRAFLRITHCFHSLELFPVDEMAKISLIMQVYCKDLQEASCHKRFALPSNASSIGLNAIEIDD